MRWTDDELRELVALWPTNSAKQIAIRMHRPRSAICGKAKRLRDEGLLSDGVHKHFEMVPPRVRVRRPVRRGDGQAIIGHDRTRNACFEVWQIFDPFLEPSLGGKCRGKCRARCHLRPGVVVWIQPLRRTSPTLSPVLIGLRVVRSPNGAHDMGIETMKKFLLGTVGLVAFGMAAPATATGFYIGANGGWGSSDSCVDFLDVTGVQCR